jgi:hypothetical protein
MALADLAGMGDTEGPATPWNVPAGFARSDPPAGRAAPMESLPPHSSGTWSASWIIFMLVLALAVLVVSRKQPRQK